jgi:TPR repeat protein
MTKSRTFPKLLAVCAVLVVAALSAVPALANFEDGVRAYLAQDYGAALEVWRPLAEDGHAPAQFGMGLSYENGRGVERDPTQAAVWYHKAADQGLADAQFNLGNLYLNASGVPKDPVEAVRWFRRAAEQGMPHAQVNLGYSYETGSGVAKDAVKAVSWYGKAAEQEFPQAQYYLGAAYERGSGVEENLPLAAAWYKRASEQGVVLAGKRLDALKAKGIVPDGDDVADDMADDMASIEMTEPEPSTVAQEAPPASAAAEPDTGESTPPEAAPEPPVTKQSEGGETKQDAQATAVAGERVASLDDSFRIRLASYRIPENAHKGWKILSKRHRDLLATLNYTVAEVDLGADKGVFHRLEAGPLGSLAEAKAICVAIKSSGDSCLAVQP